jgi:multidrug efflux system membrane fusion protein
MKRLILSLLLLGAVGAGGWWAWDHYARPSAAPPAADGGRGGGRGGRGGGRSGDGPPVPVTAAEAVRQDIPILLDSLGTVQALATITVRAQVDGVLTDVLYREGQEVAAGDVLARIDARPYQAALDQALAKKAQDEAQLANARLDLQRYQQLSSVVGASRQQVDTQKAQVAQLQAQVQSDDAAIDNARTQLSFTTLKAPVDGLVGLRLVDRGNLVRGSDATGIVTVAQVRPITVVFTLPQQTLPQVRAAAAAGPVAAAPQGGGEPAEGELVALDNNVDPQTGTIRLKAQFPNTDARLWPGAFVTVRMRVRTVRDAVTVPLVAVQRGPDGASAFVVGADGTVEVRPLRLGTLTDTLAEVAGGLAPGDRVITSGSLRLAPGTRVAVQSPAPSEEGPPAGAPPAARRRGRPVAENAAP